MKLDGKEIPKPRENVGVDYIEIARTERTISGRLVKDIIAVKRKFSISYQGLKPEEALIFIDIYNSGRAVEFEFEDVQGIEKTTVYITSLPREIFIHKPQYTKNIMIGLEEV